ncbi:VOC family protein [Spongiivirga sp. MCCC 1A20706]|uniref:VOC family protein n=1 Tax=Spongiivirga sp. MCCC 1A20706 TaxID=3160963 RepID=UPI003977D279
MDSILGFTLAVTNMDGMVHFYSKVFGISFERINQFETTLYRGEWNGLNILLCPAQIANNDAKQNRHQLDILVQDIQKSVQLIEGTTGGLLGEITQENSYQSIACYDPDNNSIILKQHL